MDSKLVNILFAVILLLSVSAKAEGPLFRQKDTYANQESDNIYQDLRSLRSSAYAPTAQTKTQLNTYTPPRAGLMFYCSDCTTDGVVVSTGTGKGAFGRISARSTAIN